MIKNGIDVEKLELRRKLLAENPSLGKKAPSALTKWLGGTKSVTKIRDFEILVDEPAELGGTNAAPTPTETLLASLGSCLVVGYAANAAVLGVDIKDLEVELQGSTDQSGFFGLSDNRGYLKINVRVRMSSTASEEELRKLHSIVLETSPVGNTLLKKNSVNVELVHTPTLSVSFDGK